MQLLRSLPFPRSSAVRRQPPDPIPHPSYRLFDHAPALCPSVTPSVFVYGTNIPSESDSGRKRGTSPQRIGGFRHGIRSSIQRSGRRADQFAKHVGPAGVALAGFDLQLRLQLHQYPREIPQLQQEERHPDTRKSAPLSSCLTTYACAQPYSSPTTPELALDRRGEQHFSAKSAHSFQHPFQRPETETPGGHPGCMR